MGLVVRSQISTTGPVALRDMIRLITQSTSLSPDEAYRLCSLAADLRVTQRQTPHARGGRLRLAGAERPSHDVDVVFLDDDFVPSDLVLAPCRGIAVEKPADHIVGLARAAMPGAKFQPADTSTVHHGARLDPWTDGRKAL